MVFALDHPFESAVTELPDGEIVGTQETFLPGERDRISYMVRQQAVRVADIRFVIDQLAHADALSPPLRGGRVDASRVAAVGHSFGGAASVAASSEDPRVVAAVNIDGTPYGELPERQLTRPFLLLQSDYNETRHSDFFINGNGALLTGSSAPGYRFEITRANHYSFTDVPMFLAPPGRWGLSLVMGGRRGPAATQEATVEILMAFLAGSLMGEAADVAAAAVRYPGVVGGAVSSRR